MNSLYQKLEKLAEDRNSIKIGLAGLGQMGKGLFSQIRDLKGMEIVALADKDTAITFKNLKNLGIGFGDYRFLDSRQDSEEENIIIESISLAVDSFSKKARKSIRKAFKDNILIYSDSLSILFASNEIDVIIDATGNPEAGAYIALNALTSGKHLVTLNVEMDVTIGPFLRDLSLKNNVVYTLSAGDEPSAAKELYDFARIMGMEIVAAGKGKNNPLDKEANPDSVAKYAKEKGSNPYMMTCFVDGTKSMVEMACLSNATGLVPDCRGMHAVKANKDQLLDLIRSKRQGGILNKSGVVEFVIGDLAPGVFLIYTTRNEIIKEELKYLLLGEGPNYLLYRPYHLTSLETPISVARACLYSEPTMIPQKELVSEVITVAKKDLKAGEKIDRIGGYKVYGLIDDNTIARKEGFLPIGLSEGALLKHAIGKGIPVTYNDVDLSGSSLINRIRVLQDKQK